MILTFKTLQCLALLIQLSIGKKNLGISFYDETAVKHGHWRRNGTYSQYRFGGWKRYIMVIVRKSIKIIEHYDMLSNFNNGI